MIRKYYMLKLYKILIIYIILWYEFKGYIFYYKWWPPISNRDCPVHSVDRYHWVKLFIHSKHIILMWSQYGGLLELQSLKDFLPSDLLWEYHIELVAVELSFIGFTSQLGYLAGVFQAIFRSIVLVNLFWISWSVISIKLRIFFLIM